MGRWNGLTMSSDPGGVGATLARSEPADLSEPLGLAMDVATVDQTLSTSECRGKSILQAGVSGKPNQWIN